MLYTITDKVPVSATAESGSTYRTVAELIGQFETSKLAYEGSTLNGWRAKYGLAMNVTGVIGVQSQPTVTWVRSTSNFSQAELASSEFWKLIKRGFINRIFSNSGDFRYYLSSYASYSVDGEEMTHQKIVVNRRDYGHLQGYKLNPNQVMRLAWQNTSYSTT